ncbi:MAG: oligosaccharide flippase family protein [Candidatus Omnitrophota bacterium]|nr:MAG: oligosaccharide flippase family protein [Candidatus Omnitrophota bacterium]
MKLYNVLKNSSFYTFATALQGMVSFFLLPIYTRYLSPKDYAILALVTSFVGIISSIITFQIHTGIPRFVNKFFKDTDRAKIYFSNIFILLFAVLLFGCIVINIFGERIIKILFSDKNGIAYSPFFLIATWTLLPTLLIGCGMTLLQTLEKGSKFFLVTLIQVVANVSFGLFFVVFLKTGPIGVLWAQLISAACGLIFITWMIRDWLGFMLPKFSKDISNSLRYSLPIIPHILSIYIYMYSDRLILQRFVPLSEIGIYSIADTFACILLIIVNATTTAYNFRFLRIGVEDRSKAQEERRKFIEIWWFGIMVIFMGYLLLSNYVVKLMTQPSFYPSIALIPILAIAYIFRGLYCFGANNLFFLEKTKFIPVITITAAIINVVLNLIFIPKFGIFAAAWTTVVSYFITFLLAYIFSQKYLPGTYPWKNILKVISLALLVYMGAKIFDRMIPLGALYKFSFNIMMVMLFGALTAFTLYREYSIKAVRVVVNFFKA